MVLASTAVGPFMINLLAIFLVTFILFVVFNAIIGAETTGDACFLSGLIFVGVGTPFIVIPKVVAAVFSLITMYVGADPPLKCIGIKK